MIYVEIMRDEISPLVKLGTDPVQSNQQIATMSWLMRPTVQYRPTEL